MVDSKIRCVAIGTWSYRTAVLSGGTSNGLCSGWTKFGTEGDEREIWFRSYVTFCSWLFKKDLSCTHPSLRDGGVRVKMGGYETSKHRRALALPATMNLDVQTRLCLRVQASWEPAVLIDIAIKGILFLSNRRRPNSASRNMRGTRHQRTCLLAG